MADPKITAEDDSGSSPAPRTCELLEERNQRLWLMHARLRRHEDRIAAKDVMISDLQGLVEQLEKDKARLRQRVGQKP